MSPKRARRYCLTINNPTVTKESVLEEFKKRKVLCAIIGKETSESGTPHLQCYVHFSTQISFQALKDLYPTAHIEVSSKSSTDIDNERYCSKEGDFVKYGVFKGKPDTIKSNREIIKRKANNQEVLHIDKYVRYNEFYDRQANQLLTQSYKYQQFEEYKNMKLRTWQLHVYKELEKQTDRQILWVYDHVGGFGKTFMARYLHILLDCFMSNGVTSAKDFCYLLPTVCSHVIFDIARSDSSLISYQSLEHVKNGYVISPKYHGLIREFPPPKVLVFANCLPEQGVLSADRLVVINLDGLPKEEISQEAPFSCAKNPYEIPSWFTSAEESPSENTYL